MLDILSAGQTSTRNWTYTRYAKCHVVMSMDIPDDRDRTDTLAQRLRGKKIKEINCFILHCIGLDFKYGSSVCLETTENTLQRWQTEVLGEPCVPSQLLHGFCISCGVQDKHENHLLQHRLRKLQYCSAPQGSATGLESLSRCYLYGYLWRQKAFNFSGTGAFFFIIWKSFEGFCDFFKN